MAFFLSHNNTCSPSLRSVSSGGNSPGFLPSSVRKKVSSQVHKQAPPCILTVLHPNLLLAFTSRLVRAGTRVSQRKFGSTHALPDGECRLAVSLMSLLHPNPCPATILISPFASLSATLPQIPTSTHTQINCSQLNSLRERLPSPSPFLGSP